MQADRPGKPTQPPTLVAALASEPKLAAKHPSLGDFLRSRWADAAFMTAAGMAETTGLPTTTLIRLLVLLGYPNFRRLRAAVLAQLRSG
ncbi:MAG: hypothetical protein E5V85_23750 [Mesorhizobium sp.]|nr:MAG: hypothetical protein E5V85_23750 [Mesorhizobium sp.]